MYESAYDSISWRNRSAIFSATSGFVAKIGKSVETYGIVSVIIDIEHHFRKTVCAEGVENETHLSFLGGVTVKQFKAFCLVNRCSQKSMKTF